ncbi:MAG: response regulator transcription factor [Saprospiraceae bacterium]|nr:MAG: LuxR family transcriptional regulator [Bacteroidetes bacterium OLB9]MCO6463098.1 response regulator transcription factor [Saprospiraceae bacterium]
MINVIIFDNNNLVVTGLHAYFKSTSNIEVVADFSSSQQLIEHLQSSQSTTDVLLLALHTKENLGLDLIRQVRNLQPTLYIIVYSRINNEINRNCCLQSGANYYYCTYSPLEELYNHVKNIPSYKSEFHKNQILLKLTPKEKQLIEYLSMGMTSKEIAHQLKVSVNTINNQKNHLISKFDCVSSTQLIIQLIRLGYLHL